MNVAQNDDIPELIKPAKTMARCEDEIVTAVLTGVTNASSEALNGLAKLEARMASSFRNPADQRRRLRTAYTRTARRPRPHDAAITSGNRTKTRSRSTPKSRPAGQRPGS